MVWQSKADDYLIVQCAMLYGLESGLQKRFEHHGAYEMFQELKLIFQDNIVATRPQTVKPLCFCVIPGLVCWHTQYINVYIKCNHMYK